MNFDQVKWKQFREHKELLTESCNPFEVSFAWMNPKGQVFELEDIRVPNVSTVTHANSARYLIGLFHKNTNLDNVVFAEDELIKKYWVKVSNQLVYAGLHPSQIPDDVWQHQVTSIKRLIVSCPYKKEPPYFYYGFDKEQSNSFDDGATNYERFFTWLLQKGKLAKSSLAMFREALEPDQDIYGWIDPDGEYISNGGGSHDSFAWDWFKKHKEEPKKNPVSALIEKNWIRVANSYSFEGRHPELVPRGIWFNQVQTIQKILSIYNLRQVVPYYDYDNLKGSYQDSYRDGANTKERFINWLLLRGNIAKSDISRFREALDPGMAVNDDKELTSLITNLNGQEKVLAQNEDTELLEAFRTQIVQIFTEYYKTDILLTLNPDDEELSKQFLSLINKSKRFGFYDLLHLVKNNIDNKKTKVTKETHPKFVERILEQEIEDLEDMLLAHIWVD